MIDPLAVRAANIEILRSWDVPTIDHLPTLEEESDLSPPAAIDVARRCVVLNHVIGIGFGGHAPTLAEALYRWGLMPYTSDRERDLFSRSEHTDQEKINATWQVECVQSFAWCLGLADMKVFEGCDDDLSSKFPGPFVDPRPFIESARLRPFEEIYRQADLHYRIHWAARSARLNGTEFIVPEGLVGERRKALDWVVGVESDWDEVPGDT